MTMKQSAPDAPALKAAPNPSSPGTYTVGVHCPYCSGVHIHGWSGPGAEGGHRRPHCWSSAARKINGAGYNITIPADLKVEATR